MKEDNAVNFDLSQLDLEELIKLYGDITEFVEFLNISEIEQVEEEEEHE
ncbi:MAG: hypothetical protein PHW32_03635 [Bacilli bacterium]|nr:hypothetical protein [Bacilli bacterium]MDD4282900.1 hypothetical protein [Bacilli bacterium]MDD4718691.1 hypothetical protein [Bacilli bacterium]